MKILITGGAGFLGMHLASYLHRKNCKLTLIDIQQFDKKEYGESYKLALCDVRNRNKLDKLIKG